MLFAIFTMIMLCTQLNAIWNDETVRTGFPSSASFTWKGSNCITKFIDFFLWIGHRVIKKRASEMGQEIQMEKSAGCLRKIFSRLAQSFHTTSVICPGWNFIHACIVSTSVDSQKWAVIVDCSACRTPALFNLAAGGISFIVMETKYFT